ncbi:MAG: hypothetical protein QOJ03_2062 [Frankiaceae bacterium]|nr:hypothetical protein [Frankiaceae bacterium]
MSEESPVLGRIWLVVPALTLGLGSFAPFLYAGIRGYGKRAWMAAAALGALDAAAAVVVAGAPDESRQSSIGGFMLIAGIIVGTVLVAAFRRRSRSTPLDPLELARRNEARRREARAIATKQPHLAVEAGIGRPDLPTHYDDGGLVDVNRAGSSAIAALPGVGEALAAKIVSTRIQIGGFGSFGDLCSTLDLTPQQLDDAEDHLLFIPL